MGFRLRGFTSLLLTWCFLVLSVSGVMLYFTPRGRVANWTGWTLMGLDKGQWQAVHMNLAAVFLIVTGLHLYLNWQVFWSYIKRRSAGLNLKLEMAVALLLTAVLVAGTIYDLPPLTTLSAWNETIKNSWEAQSPQSPAP